MSFKCQGQSLLCPQCCWLLVLLCCFSFVLASREGLFWEIDLVISVQHLERNEQEIDSGELQKPNKELLVVFIKRKKTQLAKMFPGNFVVSWTQGTMKSSWQLHKLVSLPWEQPAIPTLLSCLQHKHHASVHKSLWPWLRGEAYPCQFFHSATSRIFHC